MVRLKPYVIFSSDMFPVFTHAIENMQCPFNNNIAFNDGEFYEHLPST